MAGNRILLDTNIVTALFKGEEGIATKIDQAAEVFIPVIVVGELEYGALHSQQIIKNKNAINDLVNAYPVLDIDTDTAYFYGQVKAALRKQGTPIPENDVWIAAIAIKHNLTLVTRDKHFQQVHGITLEEW